MLTCCSFGLDGSFLRLVLFKGDPRPSGNSGIVLSPAPSEVTNTALTTTVVPSERAGNRGAGLPNYDLRLEVARGPASQHRAGAAPTRGSPASQEACQGPRPCGRRRTVRGSELGWPARPVRPFSFEAVSAVLQLRVPKYTAGAVHTAVTANFRE